VVPLLEETLVSWSLVIDECGGYEDLRGSNHQSVIPCVHGRMELYCSSLSCLCEPETYLFPVDGPPLVKWRLPEPFIAQGGVVTTSPEAQQVASGQVKPYAVGYDT
jgi:hypothetical protein